MKSDCDSHLSGAALDGGFRLPPFLEKYFYEEKAARSSFSSTFSSFFFIFRLFLNVKMLRWSYPSYSSSGRRRSWTKWPGLGISCQKWSNTIKKRSKNDQKRCKMIEPGGETWLSRAFSMAGR